MKNSIHFLPNQTNSQMMSFVIETKDGKVIVIDGGTRGDAEYLLSVLREVTGENHPTVNAWFMTHAHDDHTHAFLELLDTHLQDFTVENLYYHFPSVQFMERNEPIFCSHIQEFYQHLPVFAPYARIISAGDSYQIGAAKFDILSTADPAFTMNAGNNHSAVIRMTLGGKTVMFLGDLGVEAGEKLLKQYQNQLKSDYVQMAHHGQNGVDFPVYQAIAPEACFWPTPKWLWENDAGLGYNTHSWKTIIVRGWMEQLGVQRHYINKDGRADIDLPD